MKRTIRFLAVISAILALVSCSDDNPSEPEDENPPVSPYSGSFTIADTLDYNDCTAPPVYLDVVNVTVEGDSIRFAGFWGDWDEGTLTGGGVSPEVTIPIPPICNSYYTFSFEITYTDTDHFYGWYHLSYRKDPECPNPDPCEYQYRIGGSR
jgi:hypothetical protein